MKGVNTNTDTSRSLHRGTEADSLAGLLLGRRERQVGHLRVIAELRVREAIEEVPLLSVAERVAFMLAERIPATFAVIGLQRGYMVVELETTLDAEQLASFHQPPNAPLLMSVACAGRLVPIAGC